ncbi:MAG: tRNA threonylcarbamoyladenosine biosynthesis protein TsaB [Candidatus Atribacteria bacterium]|nr:tRNA threonylcarbamoyladenosine biosynthesis protein TsaB [Candidatus Atribacteria bacterium]
MIIALDASTPWLTLALSEGEDILFSVTHHTREAHSQWLIKYIKILKEEFALSPDRLELVLVGLGPGSFTGVKIGNLVAKAIAYSYHKPLWGFSTLELLASRVKFDPDYRERTWESIVPVIYHKKEEIFWGEYSSRFGRFSVRVQSIAEFIEEMRGKNVLLVTPWAQLRTVFEEEKLLCFPLLLSFPRAEEFIRLFYQRRSQLAGAVQFNNVFEMTPLYGSKIFES